ncbi:hypothetical protein [Secundilactobacillus collinoides]|uniref:Uncharacterized protein n=3 Tax=Secundilactobacillus collinoides TaxID=33960 RepID=A0A0R2B4A3_SECCO|nr:hypothetical protein [Secundilactobacillus collinoides]KRM73829.1 hypothetical protein FC82_GL001028 [Secundilactobacillus collinoides DSM 20515 = JCM 1123]KZL35558.1 hypothetical protein TY91_16755 [Secundilactobacillus collinoides]
MKKTFLIKGILTLIATIGIGVGFGAVQHPQTAQASTKFSQSELQGPTGYFKSAKAGYAFRWTKIKVGNSGHIRAIIMGDFKAPQLTMVIPVKNSFSKSHRTLNVTYRAVSNGKIGSKNYKLSLYKKTGSTYTAKLTKYKDGRAVNVKGTTYTFTKTKTSPAKSYASAYTKPVIEKLLTNQYNAYVEKEYQDDLAKGENVEDPAESSDLQTQIKDKVATETTKEIKQFVDAFNG